MYSFLEGGLEIGYKDDLLYFLKTSSRIDKITFGERNDFSDLVFSQINQYLKGERKSFTIPYVMTGTEFQKGVWRELIKIPYGEVRTYREVASLVGNPKAYRAVGMACNKNPIHLLIPCHRVVGTNGALTGFAGGLDLKRKLLNLERDFAKLT